MPLSVTKQHNIDFGKQVDRANAPRWKRERLKGPQDPKPKPQTFKSISLPRGKRQIDLAATRRARRLAVQANKIKQTKPWTWWITPKSKKVSVAVEVPVRVLVEQPRVDNRPERSCAVADAIDICLAALQQGYHPITSRVLQRLYSESARLEQ